MKVSGIVKTVGIIMILTLFSRLMALLSNQFYLVKLSIDAQMDVFSYALSLPNIIFAGIGTALTTVVVPIFSGHMENKDKNRAFGFIRNIMTLAIVVTISITIIGYFLMPFLINFTAFKNNGMFDFAVFATRCMLVVMFFYALTFIFQGVLQSSGRFVAQSIVSLPGSLLVIIYLIFWGDKYGVRGLIFATIIGLSLQAIIMIPSMRKVGFDFKFALNIKDPDLIMALKLIPPVFIGTSAWQLNMLFNSTLAANYPAGPTLINLVQNLITSGVMTFVFSVTAVVFPKLSAFFTSGENDDFKKLFAKSINSVLFVLIPLAGVVIILSEEILNLIYGWGRITRENINMAGIIMALYSIGIIGHSVKEIADRAFYSIKETLKPAINGVVIMVLNILASLLLVKFLGVYGIPLGYSISLTSGAIIILFMLRKRIGSFGGKFMLVNIIKLIFSTIVMTITIFFFKKVSYNIELGTEMLHRIICVVLPSGAGIIVFLIVAWFARIKEAEDMIGKLNIVNWRNSK